MKTLTRITCALMALMIAACDNAGNNANANQPAKATIQYPFKVTTTCGMVTDIVKVVAGDKGKVTGLMRAGVDPHLYKPKSSDNSSIIESDIIFYSGLMLEGRMADTFVKAARQGKPAYPVTELIDESYLLEPEDFEGHWDPHVWMDVAAWSKAVGAVAKALSEFDPANAAYYKTNADAYQKQLEGLHGYVKKSIASIPREKRVLITAHDAFNYFARAYDIEVKGVQGISTESEAGLQHINEIVDFIVENKIGAVFVESTVNPRYVESLIEGAKARGQNVVIGGELFSDAMGEEGTYEGTYLGMLDHNATIITRALGGQVPKGGMNNQLSEHE